ncbi:circularly permuted type 2 ATP-grasp protein [Piscinibacter sakaiensis]|uniref:circularly permuted type 2 ATP-grasp protein n=1 Tax=Piscinibacter sakaiensis TaxID=1547922 RepID=UPI003AAD1D8C
MLEKLLAGYSPQEGRYDELLDEHGKPRQQWETFIGSLLGREGAEVGETLSLMEREIHASGITYNVYADPKGSDRPWEVDPLPLLLSEAEWQQIEEGIAQRAELLNLVLADIYGPQKLLSDGQIPPPVVFGHSGFLHQAQHARPPGGIHLFHYAADLARSPDGKWWVVGDRTQAPSGAGYALENRLIVSRVFPQMFHDLHVQHLASFFDAWRESLLRWAPKGDGSPLVVVLTPGPYNETYFEHALLARYLGFPLVEGGDLTVRDGRVWMKTVEGLKRVHAMLRRQDDNFCDPLELRSDSALGVPGLTECARRGSVLICNALGAGVIESSALLAYLPALSRTLLDEPLKLPSVATWWLGEEAALAEAWDRLDRLIIKPLDRALPEPALFGADLDAAARKALWARIKRRPSRYVAQEWVRVSQAPVLERDHGDRGELVSARTVGLRVFAVATPDGYRVMPGGLARVAGDGDSRVIAMQRGGRSKDTWVLSETPVNASFSLLTTTVKPDDLISPTANLPSRGAENLYWYGRYGERCDATARLLRVNIAGVLDEQAEQAIEATPAALLADRFGLIDCDDEQIGLQLLRAATHPQEGLSMQLSQLLRCAFNLRDRMSADNWRSLNQLVDDPIFTRGLNSPLGLPLAMVWLDKAVTSMMTLSGFALDGMTRGLGWRFLSIGRRVERLSTLCAVLQVAINEGRTQRLDWLLALNDSTVTYRSRYLVAPEWLPVLDLLLRDAANPRSIGFQLKGLHEYVLKLESRHGPFAGVELTAAVEALRGFDVRDLDPESEALANLLGQLQRCARAVSDELSLKFFSHASSRSMLSLAA